MNLETAFEFRLCSIAGANWLERLSAHPSDALIPSAKEQFGLMFGRAIERKRREVGAVGDFLRQPSEGLIMASPSDVFASVGFAVSIVHVAASAAVIEARGAEQKEAYELAAFFSGKEPYSKVPARLSAVGAYSCVAQAEAERFAAWLKAIPGATYEEEVADMFGPESTSIYRSGLDSLARIMESTRVHGADLCCVESASGSR